MADKRHRAPIRSNTDNGQQWSGDMDAMNRLFAGTNPERVIKAGPVYGGVASKFEEAAGTLRAQISALTGVWKGDDAEATVKQMRRLQASAENIRQVADQASKALSDHGPKLKWYKDHQPKEGFFKGLTWDHAGVVTGGTLLGGVSGGLIGLTKGEALGLIKDKESETAVEHVQRLSGRAREANTAMPEEISTDIPKTGIYRERPKNFPGGGLPGGGGGIPGGGGSIPGGLDGVGSSGDGTMHGGYGGGIPGGSPTGSDLAGLPGGGGGAGIDPFGRGGLGGGGLPGGGGGGGLPGGGLGAGGIAGGMPGGAGIGTGRGGVGGGNNPGKAAGTGRGGMGGMPMGGGRDGGGNGQDEHERTTWLTEDDDVWGGNDDDAAPPVIG
ncbi:WXG100 family type VII secretion target [Actinomadura soli]|nr:WXG100 family type VII secretion target [Actinomadura soli]